MPKTNWDNVDAMQAAAPHTFNALQHLVMAMAKLVKYRGKKSLFGRDRGLAAYKTFEVKLKDTVLALVLDGVITRDASAEEAPDRYTFFPSLLTSNQTITTSIPKSV